MSDQVTASVCANCSLEVNHDVLKNTIDINANSFEARKEISIRSALSVVLNHSTTEDEDDDVEDKNDDDQDVLKISKTQSISLCTSCADSLSILYTAFKSFMSLCALDSDVAKLVQECDNLHRNRIKREHLDDDHRDGTMIKEEPSYDDDYDEDDGDGDVKMEDEDDDDPDDSINNEKSELEMEDDDEEGVEYPEEALEVKLDMKSSNSTEITTEFEKLVPCEPTPSEPGPSQISPPKKRQRQHCPYCSFNCLQKSQLVNHISRDHAKTRVDCIQCAENNVYKSFACRSDLLMHIASVHMAQPQRYECTECGKVFPQERNFLIHQKTHEEERKNPSWKCELCEKSYRQEGRLLRHMKLDHGDDSGGYDIFRCEVCDTNFKDVGSLKRHLNRIHGPLTEEDTLRDKRMSRRKRSGRPKGSYPCSECAREFTHYGTLRAHVETVHRQIKKEVPLVVCEQCGKTLKGQANYKIHLMTHENRAPDAGGICPHCSKGFTRRDTLRNHIRFVHNGVPWPKPKNGWPKKKNNSKKPRKKSQPEVMVPEHVSTSASVVSISGPPIPEQVPPMNITGNDGFYFFNL